MVFVLFTLLFVFVLADLIIEIYSVPVTVQVCDSFRDHANRPVKCYGQRQIPVFTL